MNLSLSGRRRLALVSFSLAVFLSITMASLHVTAATGARGPRSRSDKSRTGPTEQPMRYRFKRGQSFVYLVDLQRRYADRTERLSGAPYFVVTYADESEASLLVIGRLRYEEITAEGKSRKIPAYDYWMGAATFLDKTADRIWGRLGRGPDKSRALGLRTTRLLFPEIPNRVNGELGCGQTITSGKITWGAGQKPTDTRRTGFQSHRTSAKPLRGSLVQLDIELKFEPKNGSAPSGTRSIATFDSRLGQVIEHVARNPRTEGRESYVEHLHVRRLDRGAAFEEAKKIALEDAKSLPKEMEPIELMRKRLGDLGMTDDYSTDDLPAPGTVVGYYDHGWFAAEYVKQIEPYKVLIRYVGSGETETIHPGQMAKLRR